MKEGWGERINRSTLPQVIRRERKEVKGHFVHQVITQPHHMKPSRTKQNSTRPNLTGLKFTTPNFTTP
ncbi:MAG: hypothetical protein V2I33_18290, partial [Kangiellaceae bacterium]|nr:hypothetical protein [Kangiellaceae bacterium]